MHSIGLVIIGIASDYILRSARVNVLSGEDSKEYEQGRYLQLWRICKKKQKSSVKKRAKVLEEPYIFLRYCPHSDHYILVIVVVRAI